MLLTAAPVAVGPTFIPNSTTVIVAKDVKIGKIVLSNTTAGALTVTISDRSTSCNGGACQIWPAISIAANTVYTADLGGTFMQSGISWSASAANSVIGAVNYDNCWMLKQCAQHGCPELLPRGGPSRCPAHTATKYSEKNATRGPRAGLSYSDAAWHALRLLKLSRNPWCEIKTHCRNYSLLRQLATEVDHIKPIAERPELRLVWSNLQSACKPCHSAKTINELRQKLNASRASE